MLKKIIEFSVRNKLIIGLFTIVLILYGSYEATRLPIDAQPDITNNQVQVITVAPSFGALDMERLVTFPVEMANSNIPGIEEIRSFSRFGLSLVTIVFDDRTDIYWARQQVSERLLQVKDQIPEGIGTPELGPISTGLGEIYQYVVRPEKGYEHLYDETALRTIQDWVIRRQLLGVKGVADVSSFGGKQKQYEIAIDPHRLQAYGLNIRDVFDALKKNNQNTGGAYIEKGPVVLFIRSEGLIGSVEDIENIRVASTFDRVPVCIRDIARVHIGHAPRYGAMTYNEEGEVAGAIVMMLRGANSNEVIRAVKKQISEIQHTLPEGVLIEPFIDRSKMVNNTISTVRTNLLEGALIVVFILVLFLGNFRAGLLVASVIPLSMLFAIIMMNLFGVGGNLMSLGALDFGLIVDGAVIIVEAVMHQLSRYRLLGFKNIPKDEMDLQVISSASRMANSAVFGQMIILIVYLPIFTLSGIEGKMFKPMAQTVAFALIGAFILSLTYIPMMSALVLKKGKKTVPNLSDRLMNRAMQLHQKYLIKAFRRPKQILTVVILLLVLAAWMLSRMGGEFIPSLEEGDFAVEVRILPGSNIPTTIAYTSQAAKGLMEQFPEIEKIVTKIGSGEIPTEPMPMDAGDMIIVLKPKKEWTSAKTFPELSGKMSQAIHAIPGMTSGFQFPVQMRFNELMTGARQDVVLKIFGEDLDTLARYAEVLGSIIQTVAGAQDIYLEPVIGMPQVVIDYDRPAIARYGLSVEEINQVVQMAFAGRSAGVVFEGERRFDLVVRLDTSKRQTISDIRNLLIPTPAETQIPLSQLAAVNLKNTPNQIQREDAKRRIVVGFNVRGRDVQRIVEELQRKLSASVKLPAGYHITYGGTFENLNQAKERLRIAVPVSLLLIFLLLFFAFRSVKHSLLIYTAIPLSAIGGVMLLFFRGIPFSISAGVGFIALFGVAVLNGIVLIAEFNRLKSLGRKDIIRIVITGTKTRLRPVLMTAFVASLGFLPMAISTGSGAEVQRPLATVVIGGLMLATFLTLFVLPLLYALSENIHPGRKDRKAKLVRSAFIMLFLFHGVPVFSQHPVTLQQATDMALQNGFSAKDSRLMTAYRKEQKAAYLDLSQTMIHAEYGRIHSWSNDYKTGVSQHFSFPSVYTKRKTVLNFQWKEAVVNEGLTAALIGRAVSGVFYEILFLKEKEHLLARTDSLFQKVLEKADNRFQQGATSLMEKTFIEIQRSQIAIQLRHVHQGHEQALLQFRLLLNTDKPYVPAGSIVDQADQLLILPEEILRHPELQLYEQKVHTAAAGMKWEKSKLLPGLSAGYYIQSMADISRGPFQAVEFGIGIPLFFKSQKAVIEAAKQQVGIAENTYAYQKAKLKSEYEQALLAYGNHFKMVREYRQVLLPDAEQIFHMADQQFSTGEIDYLQWTVLNKQAMEIQHGYIDALQELNKAIIELDYLLYSK